MEKIDIEKIRVNLPYLIKYTDDLQSLCTHLYASKCLTSSNMEECMARPTRHAQCSYLYNILPRRGPLAFKLLVDALQNTNNTHVADLLLGKQQQPPQSTTTTATMFGGSTSTAMFGGLVDALDATRPIETTNERSSLPVYKVSVNVYSGELPKSRVGLNDLPYVIALSRGISRQSVQSWSGCPSDPILTSVYETYKNELKSTMVFMDKLDRCAVDMSSRPTQAMDRAMKSNSNASLHLVSNRYDPSMASEYEKKAIAITLHLMTYGNDFTLTIRKDFEPKPSAYLIYNARTMSSVIRPKDVPIVYSIINTDESNLDTIDTPLVKCPW